MSSLNSTMFEEPDSVEAQKLDFDLPVRIGMLDMLNKHVVRQKQCLPNFVV